MAASTRQLFHESIVSLIQLAESRELEVLAAIIKLTKIPTNHNEISNAWKKRCREMGWGENDLGVSADLLEQKKMAESEWRKINEAFRNEAVRQDLEDGSR